MQGYSSLLVEFSLLHDCRSVDAIKLFSQSDEFLLYDRFNISNSFPFPHLLRERAMRAIGIILHTKVLVNLEQTLLVRDSFQEMFPARIVAEETRRSGFESTI